MKIYKFRSAMSPDFTADILKSQRLFCATIDSLNDPFEGLFSVIGYRGASVARGVVRSIARGLARGPIGYAEPHKEFKYLSDHESLKGNVRVCSLSKNLSDVRMWSHYADGHKGCAIEMEMDLEPPFFEVRYEENVAAFSSNQASTLKAEDILTFKTKHWEYEQEVRIITNQDYFNVDGKISAVYLGVKSTQQFKDIVRENAPSGVKVVECKLDQNHFLIVPNELDL